MHWQSPLATMAGVFRWLDLTTWLHYPHRPTYPKTRKRRKRREETKSVGNRTMGDDRRRLAAVMAMAGIVNGRALRKKRREERHERCYYVWDLGRGGWECFPHFMFSACFGRTPKITKSCIGFPLQFFFFFLKCIFKNNKVNVFLVF